MVMRTTSLTLGGRRAIEGIATCERRPYDIAAVFVITAAAMAAMPFTD